MHLKKERKLFLLCQKNVKEAMKTLLTIVLLFVSNLCIGQSQLFNCKIFEEIVKSIDREKVNIELYKKIKGKFKMVRLNGKDSIIPTSTYANDSALHQILNLNNIREITRSIDDSLFYL